MLFTQWGHHNTLTMELCVVYSRWFTQSLRWIR